MNMQFKQERRDMQAYSSKVSSQLTEDYWHLCWQFLEMMEVKRSQNLQNLSQVKNFQGLYDSIRSEVDFDVHCAIGLGRRMPIPPQLNLERA